MVLKFWDGSVRSKSLPHPTWRVFWHVLIFGHTLQTSDWLNHLTFGLNLNWRLHKAHIWHPVVLPRLNRSIFEDWLDPAHFTLVASIACTAQWQTSWTHLKTPSSSFWVHYSGDRALLRLLQPFLGCLHSKGGILRYPVLTSSRRFDVGC